MGSGLKVLLLGGAGFIGSATAKALAAKGHRVIVADSFDAQIHGPDYQSSPGYKELAAVAEIEFADVRDRPAIERLIRRAEAVYFFPAATGTGQSMYQVHRYCDVNVMGSAVFAEALTSHGDQVQTVVLSSSRAVYGEGAYRCAVHGLVTPPVRSIAALRSGRWECECPQCGAPMEPQRSKSTDPVSPTSIYGTSKLAQEQIILQTCRGLAARGLRLQVYRYQNVYGPGQSLKNPYTGILSIFSQLLARGEEVNVFEDGLPTRDFVHIDDVVGMNLDALLSAQVGGSIVDVGSGVRTTLIEVVHALAGALGVEPRHRISGDFRAGDIRHACADLAFAPSEFNATGKPFIPFREGVRSLIEWIAAQGGLDLTGDAYRNSLDEMRNAGLLGTKSGAAQTASPESAPRKAQ